MDFAVGALINASSAKSANRQTKGGQGNVYAPVAACLLSLLFELAVGCVKITQTPHEVVPSALTKIAASPKESIQRARLIEGKFTRTTIMWRYILAHGVLREN